MNLYQILKYLFVSEAASIKSRDHPEYRERNRCVLRGTSALLCPRLAVIHHTALFRREPQRRPQELPTDECPELRLQINHNKATKVLFMIRIDQLKAYLFQAFIV